MRLSLEYIRRRGIDMGLFLMILGIFLALNILPVIFGFAAMGDGDDFIDGFGAAWAVILFIIVAVGIIWFIVWLISTGWTMMQVPAEVY